MVKSEVEFELGNIGTSTPAKYLDRFSPRDNSLIFKTPLSGEKEAHELFQNISACSSKFQDLGVIKASEILIEVCQELKRNRDEINQCVFIETGKTEKLVEGEFETSLKFMTALSGLSQFEVGRVIPSANTKKNVYTKRVPIGIAALITSHNTPLPNYAWKIAPSFLSLNSSILKPSEYTSGSAQKFVECFNSVGAPQYMVNLFHGDAEAAQSIIAMKPDLISFTGSFETGMKVKSATNSYSPKLILEMGGSNPIIICKSADLKKAASVIAESAFSNSGQRCASASRLIVHESVLDNLIPLLHSSVETLVSTTGRESFSGCLVSLDAKKKHVDFLNNARLSGSNVLEFNYEKSLEGCYVNPAVVTRNQDKNQDGFVEIFSPILFVEVFNEIEEALLKANSTTYGLTAAVWTDDFSESFYFSNHVKSGVVNINGPTHGAEFQFPFGGQGFSGNGAKEVGINCLAEYSFERLISVTAYGK